jgi:hypothetical protein
MHELKFAAAHRPEGISEPEFLTEMDSVIALFKGKDSKYIETQMMILFPEFKKELAECLCKKAEVEEHLLP